MEGSARRLLVAGSNELEKVVSEPAGGCWVELKRMKDAPRRGVVVLRERGDTRDGRMVVRAVNSDENYSDPNG